MSTPYEAKKQTASKPKPIKSEAEPSPSKKRKMAESPQSSKQSKTDKTEVKTEVKTEAHFENGLPDVFANMKVFISSKLPNKAILERYVVAYGGQLVRDKHLAGGS